MTSRAIAAPNKPEQAPGDVDPSDPRAPRARVSVVIAVVVVLCGIVVALGGPVRSLLQQGAAERKAAAVATDATCFRFRSLEITLGSGSARPEEVRRRVSDLAIGAEGAHAAVAVPAQQLADDLRSAETTTDASIAGTAAWAAMAAACERP